MGEGGGQVFQLEAGRRRVALTEFSSALEDHLETLPGGSPE